MSTEIINAEVTETGDSLYGVKIDVNGHSLIGDEPESMGSLNLGPAPYDLLLSALGECTAMTVRWFALQKQWPLDRVSVVLTHQKIDKKDHFTKQIKIEGQDLTPDQRTRLLAVAANCPVHKTLMSEVVIETSEAI